MFKKSSICLIVFTLILSLVGIAEAQSKKANVEKKSGNQKQNLLANEILNSLQGEKSCFVIFDVQRGMERTSVPSDYQTIFNPKDYFLAKSVSINKVGATVSKREQNILTKEWNIKNSAPILITVEGIYVGGPNKGKSLSIKAEETVSLDKWEEWHYSSQFAPSQVCSAIYEKCVKDTIKAKEAAEIMNIGTYLDARTNLMWAVKDNGKKIGWLDAIDYCEKYRGGGYTDWRMPTQDELVTLYDESRDDKHKNIESITLTDYLLWASERQKTKAASFSFYYKTSDPRKEWIDIDDPVIALRVLPVRSAGQQSAKVTRFIANPNGTVLDTSTYLMWAGQDNGDDIKGGDAKSYCENYRGGGYTDWRMPTQGELETLLDKRKTLQVACNNSVYFATNLISISCGKIWTSTFEDALGNSLSDKTNQYYFLDFTKTRFYKGSIMKEDFAKSGMRVLPVRFTTGDVNSALIKQEREKEEAKRKGKEENSAMEASQKNYKTQMQKGDTYFKTGQHQLAIKEYDEAIRINPNGFEGYFNRGTAYANLRDYKRTVLDYTEAIRLLQSDKNTPKLNETIRTIQDVRGRAYLLQNNKDLGCADAKNACKLGECSTLKWARSQGLFGWCLGD